MEWAQINAAGIVVELTSTDPTGRYHPAIEWVECTAGVTDGWTYDGSAFHAPTAPAVNWPALAHTALDASDTTILRCYENAVAVPAAWATYRAALRSVIAGESVTALPARPAYPAGT